jgi:hypothetical protein
MTRDNLRVRGMSKPLDCKMCKEIETVKHLMFECVVYRNFNLVSSAVLWTPWKNRNNIVFNKTT